VRRRTFPGVSHDVTRDARTNAELWRAVGRRGRALRGREDHVLHNTGSILADALLSPLWPRYALVSQPARIRSRQALNHLLPRFNRLRVPLSLLAIWYR
jgi:hypothetical protein